MSRSFLNLSVSKSLMVCSVLKKRLNIWFSEFASACICSENVWSHIQNFFTFNKALCNESSFVDWCHRHEIGDVIRYTIEEFNVDWKAECSQLNLSHVLWNKKNKKDKTKRNKCQCPLSMVQVQAPWNLGDGLDRFLFYIRIWSKFCRFHHKRQIQSTAVHTTNWNYKGPCFFCIFSKYVVSFLRCWPLFGYTCFLQK